MAVVLVVTYMSFNGSSSASGVSQYALVIDAGSSGSRLHLYEFDITDGLDLKDELFKPLKPGLSSFNENPKDGGESIRPLLEAAKARVPTALHKKTPLFLGATAGLRMLGDKQANVLLKEGISSVVSLSSRPYNRLFVLAERVCREYDFVVKPDSFKIMAGTDEGKYAWVAINYLLGALGLEADDTLGVIDLGGGSVQMMRALPDAFAKNAPEGYLTKVKGGGKEYDLYVHSYDGYGLMAGRVGVLKQVR
jgi:apyrase